MQPKKKSLLLGGFMATGKTSVGPIAAERLGYEFVDTDEIVAREAGASVPDLWRREGEAGFRARERAVVERLLDSDKPHVVALGGGALLAREVRHAALDRAIVVTLASSAEEILRRAGDVSSRPNLAGPDPLGRIRYLLDARKEVYAECHATLVTDGVDLDEVADSASAVLRRDPLVLPLGLRTYTIDVVHDAPEALTDCIARSAPSSLLVVADATVRRARGDALVRALSHLALPHVDVTLPAGEEHKTLSTVSAIWDAALGAEVDRDVLVVAFGGGVVGDLAGFAASTLLRGVRFVNAPTTLLAMVDASVGGKTGFDHPSGKNLIGSIHQPSGVVVDTAHLATLPARELRCGLAEAIKVAVTCSAPLFELLESRVAELAPSSGAAFVPIIREAVAIKARIVRDDERDVGARAILNFGHTIGHALEAHGGYRAHAHGEAVALGMLAELRVGVKAGWTPAAVLDRTLALLRAAGLPTEVRADEAAAAARFVASDKKRRGGKIALPVVTAMGCSHVRDTLPEQLLHG
jgi:shikimate kinase/3-dehydroquinate synthase